jgi:hypothetical protein
LDAPRIGRWAELPDLCGDTRALHNYFPVRRVFTSILVVLMILLLMLKCTTVVPTAILWIVHAKE